MNFWLLQLVLSSSLFCFRIWPAIWRITDVCCCSITQSCPAVCDPMDCSTPGFPVLHYLPDFAQTYVHWSQWCHPTISSSAVPFSCPQSFPASESFPKCQPFTLGGQIIGTSASVLPMNIQDWFPSGLTALISLLSKRLSRVYFSTTVREHQFFRYSVFIMNWRWKWQPSPVFLPGETHGQYEKRTLVGLK